ncbi:MULTISPECIES: aminodeoxychorismate lyase [Acinetobacter]|uniref:aminodeoxychorismate lyase n=1 Tax=Acinetobacter TaxID=469 RepID=UPI000538649E|nr:aminodeoxychorismate lyase [Acinetobacter sp. HR7]KGT48150.1 4-amino-4-deoxychorismate lyase [Acinetobacter sp. HR7]
MLCFKNAQQIHHIDLLDRAFHYGDGCFTTACIRNNQVELQERHLARLRMSSQKMNLQVDLELIDATLQKLRETETVLNGTLKIIISRGMGQRGYSLPDHPADLWVYYYPKTLEEHQFEQIESGVLNTALGLCMPQLVGLKTLNRLEQVMLKQEADQQGWVEALACDVQGEIVEGVSSNCFLRINNTWITPELRYNGVSGVMRAEILERMHQQGIACEQRSLDMEEIPHIQSLFFCNALSPMKMVAQFEQRTLDTEACIALFHRLHLNQIS